MNAKSCKVLPEFSMFHKLILVPNTNDEQLTYISVKNLDKWYANCWQYFAYLFKTKKIT